MPGLTNEATHQGIIDQQQQQQQQQHGVQNTTANTSSSSTTADVYIIPDYTMSRTHPQHLLVLPFVPHPSTR